MEKSDLSINEQGKKLYVACCHGDVGRVTQLLKEGTPTDYFDPRDKKTCLHVACQNNRLDIVELLLKYKTDLNVLGSNGTPLHEACRCGSLGCVKALLATGQCDLASLTKSGDSPLRLAVREGQLDVVSCLVAEYNATVDDDLLHVACEHNRVNVVQYLLTSLLIDANVKNHQGQSPLSLSKNKAVMKLLIQHGANDTNVYSKHRKVLGNLFSKNSLKCRVKLLVIGGTGEGKTTLINTLLHEYKSRVRTGSSAVCERTSGINHYPFTSRFYGDILFYDFAGREAYYSSHAATIKSVVCAASPPILLLVVGLHRNNTDITQSVSYWLRMIASQVDIKAPLIVVGTHADQVDSSTRLDATQRVIKQAAEKLGFNPAGMITMDSRHSDTESVRSLRQCIGVSCSPIRSRLSVSLNSHMFFNYFTERFWSEIAVTLKEVLADLKYPLNRAILEENRYHHPSDANGPLSPHLFISKRYRNNLMFIPSSIPHLIEICRQLNDTGCVMFFFNKEAPGKSILTINMRAVSTVINGSLFAPERFNQLVHQLSSASGVVSQSELVLHFHRQHLEPAEAVVDILCLSELAAPIDEARIAALSSEQSCKASKTDSKKYLFCPPLVRSIVPKNVFTHLQTHTHRFGWTVTYVDTDHFFNPRFLHVLILRLALAFDFTPELAIEHPSVQRECSVWKTGVCWCTPLGVRVLVEVVDEREVWLLMQAQSVSAHALQTQSKVIQTVRQAMAEFCLSGIVCKELIIRPADVSYPIQPGLRLSLQSLASAIVHPDSQIEIDVPTTKVPISDLLPVEVYAGLGENTLQALFNESDSMHDEIVSDSFFSNLCGIWNKNSQLMDIICSAFDRPVSEVSEVSLETTFRSWRDDSDGTYRSLRKVLDTISVFAGQNLLSLAGVPYKSYHESDLLVGSDHNSTEPVSTATSLTLTPNSLNVTDHLKPLVECLWDARTRWYHLGLQLHIDQPTLEVIKFDCEDSVDDCITAVLTHYLKGDRPFPTWSHLVTALQSPPVDQPQLVSRVRELASKMGFSVGSETS